MTSPRTYHVTVTRRLPDSVEASLRERYGAQLNAGDQRLTEAELHEAVARSDVLLCTLGDRITRELLFGPGRRVQLLANFGAGLDHIDLEAARDAGVMVTNTPGVLTEDTADLTMLLLLAVARRAWEGDQELRAGAWTGWRPTHLLGTRVSGKTLGIVGMGRIGQAVARRAAAGFGMRIRYYSRRRLGVSDERRLGAEWAGSLRQLLETCDFVSLHCPATAETKHLIDAEALASMRPEAFLVNTARGDVVDEGALVAALRDGRLAGAALDVFENEPRVPPELLVSSRVVTLPHLGSATLESRVAMGECALRNIVAFVEGQEPPNRVV